MALSFIVLFFPKREDILIRIKKALIILMRMPSEMYFNANTPVRVKMAPNKINVLNDLLTNFFSFFCSTIMMEADKLQSINTGMSSVGEYQFSRKGSDTNAKPKPVMPLSRLAMSTISKIK